MVTIPASDYNNTRGAGATTGWLLLRGVRTGNTRAVKAMLEAGANVNGSDKVFQCGPLMFAVMLERVDIVDLLIRKGADVNIGTWEDVVEDGVIVIPKRSQPLHAAARACKMYIIRLLIHSGADVDATDAHGNTPLMAACNASFESVASTRADVARELLGVGADATSTNRDGGTALLFAAEYGDDVDLIDLLVSAAPATLNLADRARATPLLLAATNNKANAVRYLLAAGAKQPAAARQTRTCPLARAVCEGHGDIVRILLDEEGVDAVIGGAEMMRHAVLAAVTNKRAVILQALLLWAEEKLGLWKEGLRIDGILNFAAACPDPATIGVLLANGADENEVDHAGCRPQDMIEEYVGSGPEVQRPAVESSREDQLSVPYHGLGRSDLVLVRRPKRERLSWAYGTRSSRPQWALRPLPGSSTGEGSRV